MNQHNHAHSDSVPPPKVDQEDCKLAQELLSYLEEKLRITQLLPNMAMPRFSDFTPEVERRAHSNVDHGDRLFARLKALPAERFAVAMDLLMVAIVLRGTNSLHTKGK
ncbi:hypothetical protein [Massilia yuzhufengensis]|uniref:Uncharacterized protein n=1 Tax=Massilia yuzhufengensis TaxID=1164594 RepID=A0A1I1VM36_9BURK|nr:hypothetical protein [Massilia yuzhufengensis]SFD84077.1 hypothetical protein SAMN05216204_14043 [Massilia yuzhufengensis]